MIIGGITIQSHTTLPLEQGSYLTFSVWCGGEHSKIVESCLALTMPVRFTEHSYISSININETYHQFSNGCAVFPTAENTIALVACLKEQLPIGANVFWSDLTGSCYQEIA